MGRLDGEVKRETCMLKRSYKDPIQKHSPRLTNRYSLDFGDTTGKQMSKYGKMTFEQRK